MGTDQSDHRAPLSLVLLFVDGLDRGFLTRNLKYSNHFSRLFPDHWVYGIEGSAHELARLAELYAGQRLPEAVLTGDAADGEAWREWDELLAHVPGDRLLWHRLAALGCRVGLLGMPGLCLPPALDGFSVAPATCAGEQALAHDAGLTHHPVEVGRRFAELRGIYGYPPEPAAVLDYREDLRRPIELHNSRAADKLMARCRYGLLLDRAERAVELLVGLCADLLREWPVDVLALHVAEVEPLLHVFFGLPERERQVMQVLDALTATVQDLLSCDEVVVCSSHGMAPTVPHPAGRVFYRTLHDASAAVLAASGRRTRRILAGRRPRDLTDAYRVVVQGAAGARR